MDDSGNVKIKGNHEAYKKNLNKNVNIGGRGDNDMKKTVVAESQR